MAGLEITLACRDYDHTRGLRDGTVAIDGVHLRMIAVSPPSQIFLRMLRNEEFDASEMSLSNYMIALGRGDRRFVAIPVFPSRVFRHSYIWVNTKSGIKTPQDLRGKRVGILDYSMTALLFIRGMLKHQYGVQPEEIDWFRSRSEHVSIKTPPGIRIENIGESQTLDDWLEAGKLDAVAVTSAPRGFRKGLPFIRRLFDNSREVEAEYYRQTKIFPIMHTVVIRRAIYEQNPWLAAALTNAFQSAKGQAYERFKRGSLSAALGQFGFRIRKSGHGRRHLLVRSEKQSSDLGSGRVILLRAGTDPPQVAGRARFSLRETLDLLRDD